MKTILFSSIRALCAIAVGALLIEYREDMVKWITMAIGGLFFVAGLAAVGLSYSSKRAIKKAMQQLNANLEAGNAEATIVTRFKGWRWGMMAGMGSMLLGVALILLPNTFVAFLVNILSFMLILGAVGQFVSLAGNRRLKKFSLLYWLMPLLLLACGIMAVVYPEVIASAPLLFIGWSMIIYGVFEIVNGIKTYQCHKHTTPMTPTSPMQGKPNFADAEEVEFEECKE